MKAATLQLKNSIQKGIVDKKIFTNEELLRISKGESKISRKWTWHHHQDSGRMQLIPFELHDATKHKGGMSLWYEKK